MPYRDVAAVVSPAPTDRALGTPADLRAHASVLEAVAGRGAVLPLRFGGVLPAPEAVTADLLEPYRAELAESLNRVAGQQQFTVKGRYLSDAPLREILTAEPRIRRLRAALRGRDLDLYRGAGIELGELVARALERKQQDDTAALTSVLAPHATAVAERPLRSPETAADVAFLVAGSRRRRFEAAAEDLGRDWNGRVRLRLTGPLPPYDFAQIS
jgi:hypothetical protein